MQELTARDIGISTKGDSSGQQNNNEESDNDNRYTARFVVIFRRDFSCTRVRVNDCRSNDDTRLRILKALLSVPFNWPS